MSDKDSVICVLVFVMVMAKGNVDFWSGVSSGKEREAGYFLGMMFVEGGIVDSLCGEEEWCGREAGVFLKGMKELLEALVDLVICAAVSVCPVALTIVFERLVSIEFGSEFLE